MMKKEL
jgi:hypothetical protein